MARSRPGAKPLYESMMVSFPASLGLNELDINSYQAQQSRLIPMCNARFIQCGHRRSPPVLEFLNMGREHRWPRWINKGVAYRYQEPVVLRLTAW